MRKINKLAAAIAVAVGVGVASTANAVIELKPNGRGDALLFPIYHGYFENYFTISNMANAWVQGHLRFRGAAWSGEVRDFDVILSPGDVMVFRLADIDGDGQWEIDQSLDPLNFKYTGMWASESMPFTCKDGGGNPIVGCMEMSTALIPTTASCAQLTEGVVEYQKQAGYVEFIGESVLDGMDHNIMGVLIDPSAPANSPYIQFRTKVFNKLGTTAWVWSDADGSRGGASWADDQGLSDVPNALSGTAFITNPGWSHGLAYNAETLVNFRTATCGGDTLTDGDAGDDGTDGCAIYPHGEHRVDNYRIGAGDSVTSYVNLVSGKAYGKRSTVSVSHTHPREGIAGFSPLAENRSVIVHDENGAVAKAGGNSPFGDYVYWWESPESREEEKAIAFNNTWGPTLADGDDYEMTDAFAVIASNELLPGETGSVNVNGDPWALRWTDCPFILYNNNGTYHPVDDYDCAWAASPYALPFSNSLAEVDEAIRAAGQTFTAYYMHNDTFDKSGAGNGRADGINSDAALTTQFISFFPTKFLYFEYPNPDGAFKSLDAFTCNRAVAMTAYPKDVNVQIWDTQERPLGMSVSNECISPATLGECFTAIQGLGLHFEVGVMGIDFVKNIIAPDMTGWNAGRAVFELLHDGTDSPYLARGGGSKAFAGFMYAFEWDDFPPQVLTHWRSMNR